ncbi:dihydroorotate dehydrogenase (quinone), mitochondrial [Phymastichus coffea]|uniref:dihydroorotate dehydrogenase (quinone), mitochondrial n=1 Tax=Phymastichus coffea TaxID=108790 RepID=UPI00273BED1B|nr:dihydroorotate dehydrogenase (quinone), mitochondrial [Phymastichus coffea]
MTRPIDLTIWRKIKSLLGVTTGATIIFSGISLYQGNEKYYKEIFMPLVRLIDPETAHRAAIITAKLGLIPTQKHADPHILHSSLWGLHFQNPLGMAAGFDKHAEAIEGLHKMGFGFVEIGSVTPEPQPGNSKPRVFRLPEDQAIINRYGFNSDGHEVVHSRLKALKNSNFSGIVGVNLGKNKLATDPVHDYVEGIRKFSDVADYFVINVSSPNTPGLRNLQRKNDLQELLQEVNKIRATTDKKPPLLLKIAPDLSKDEQQDVADVIQQTNTKVDGIIISNTTLSRKSLINNTAKNEAGGLSGAPVSNMSTEMIANMYKLTKGLIPIIGVGGIFDGEDAYTKIKAGASLIQIYTSFAYHGPPIVSKIKEQLGQLLTKDGHNSIADAVGIEAKKVLSEVK